MLSSQSVFFEENYFKTTIRPFGFFLAGFIIRFPPKMFFDDHRTFIFFSVTISEEYLNANNQ
jgi:hypothetical protein